MSNYDRDKWNQRYAKWRDHNNQSVTFLETWLPKLPIGRALDVACGTGQNALILAQAGYQVDAIDISDVGLERARQKAEQSGYSINCIEHDLDQPYCFDSNYDLIIVFWYVNLDLIASLDGCLAPGGYLLCQEHLITDQAVIGPDNPNYRVAPGALPEILSGVDVVRYDEGIETNAAGESVASARLVARKPANA